MRLARLYREKLEEMKRTTMDSKSTTPAESGAGDTPSHVQEEDSVMPSGELLELLLHKDRQSSWSRWMPGLIHNINGLLHNISMLVEMIQKNQEDIKQAFLTVASPSTGEKAAPLDKQTLRLQQLNQQVSLLSEMLLDIKILHEIEEGESEVDLKLLLYKLAKVFRADLFFKHHVALELELGENIPLIRIPGKDLVPALIHLFQNALTAMYGAPLKTLSLSCRREGDTILIAFRDTGCGLPHALQAAAPDPSFCLFSTHWPEDVLQEEKGEKHFGAGLFAAQQRLAPYGVKVRLSPGEGGQGTAAVLEFRV